MDLKSRHIYERLPLPALKSTRLLTIVPGSYKDNIECTLEVVDLDENPNYFALSYVWNPPDLRDVPPVEVICNGVPVDVTPNLGAALRRLRRQRSSSLSNMLRKGFRREFNKDCQVSFMGAIYDSAQDVFVWLGEDSGYASEAMSFIRRVAKVARRERHYDQPEVDTRTTKKLPTYNDESLSLIDRFYSNPWFRRVWVIQEVARENSLVLLGSHEMPLLDVCICSKWMRAKFYAFSIKRNTLLDPSESIYDLKYGAPFLDALTISSTMGASDPRDKIYALLGIYSKWADLNEVSIPSFRPDYEKPVPLVYTEFIRYYLSLPRYLESDEGSLRIIIRNETFIEKDGQFIEPDETECRADFPSWVPRWDQSRPKFTGLLLPANDKWNPSHTLTPTVGETKVWGTLSLKGFEVSTIAFLERGFVLRTLGLTSDSIVTIIKRTLDNVARITWRYPGGDELKQALAHTLTASEYKDKGTHELFDREDLDTYLNEHDSCTNTKGSWFADHVTWRYAFFTTANGYMGLASRKAQIGDKICLLYGGEVLFILRPAEEGYRLVGECYVDGLMYGAAMEMLETGEAKEQCFDLQ